MLHSSLLGDTDPELRLSVSALSSFIILDAVVYPTVVFMDAHLMRNQKIKLGVLVAMALVSILRISQTIGCSPPPLNSS